MLENRFTRIFKRRWNALGCGADTALSHEISTGYKRNTKRGYRNGYGLYTDFIAVGTTKDWTYLITTTFYYRAVSLIEDTL